MLVDLKTASKEFVGPEGSTQTILTNIDLAAEAGSMHSVLGRSGCGKSTLLSLLGLLDTPDSGSYTLDGHDTAGLKDRTLSKLRSDTIGFIYQRFFLLGHLTAYQNVDMALLHAARPGRRRRRRVMEALEQVGLAAKPRNKPSQLSGGEQQRVAIARALVRDPKLILADEPTGALDEETSEEVLDLLMKSTRERDACLIAVTHDQLVAGKLGNVHRMAHGAWETA